MKKSGDVRQQGPEWQILAEKTVHVPCIRMAAVAERRHDNERPAYRQRQDDPDEFVAEVPQLAFVGNWTEENKQCTEHT
jgi:hypothetical protein